MLRRFIFASESVGEGHPDKVCDTISDAVLDACLRQDPHQPRRLRDLRQEQLVIVGGEITIPNLPSGQSLESSCRSTRSCANAVREIGYVNDDDVFHADKIGIQNIITDQSPDISQGVDASEGRRQRARRTGRGRPGFDVWFRLRRDAGIDAGADHVCASARPRADPHSQERQGATGSGRMRSRRSRSSTTTASRSAFPTLSSRRSTPKDVKHSEIRRFLSKK